MQIRNKKLENGVLAVALFPCKGTRSAERSAVPVPAVYTIYTIYHLPYTLYYILYTQRAFLSYILIVGCLLLYKLYHL